ncbi:hypothetical protein GCM10027450_14820 [Pseudidiomarina andamanensis]
MRQSLIYLGIASTIFFAQSVIAQDISTIPNNVNSTVQSVNVECNDVVVELNDSFSKASPDEISEYAKCCKVCRKGKACGDSCISRSKNCNKGKGCACDG